MPTIQLTKRQADIAGYISSQIHGNGRPPTVREIGNAFGILSPNGVMCHLKALEKKGVITRSADQTSRGIMMPQPFAAKPVLPCWGKIS